MKKQFMALAVLAITTAASKAQTVNIVTNSTIQPTESTLKIDKTDRTAIAADYNMSEDAIKDALKEIFKSKGVKLEKSKGLLVAKAVSLQEMGNNTFDLYFSADAKSRSEKDKSVLKMALSSGYDNFIGPANADAYLLAKNYMISSLSRSLYAEKNQVDISAQTESFTKAQKKYNDLLKENEKLEKQKKNVEGDIAENKRNQDLQSKEVERQKAALDLLKSRVDK